MANCLLFVLLTLCSGESNGQANSRGTAAVELSTKDSQQVVESAPLKFREHLPFPLQPEPTESDRLGYHYYWPELPTKDRIASIRDASVDHEIALQVNALPGDAIKYSGNFVGYSRRMSDVAEQIARDMRPEVDRTLIATLDDPNSPLLSFRLAHHLLLARYTDYRNGPVLDAAPILEAAVADLPRPVNDDRSAIRAYWHVVLGESEFLPDFVRLLHERSIFFVRFDLAGRMIAGTHELGTLVMLRVFGNDEIYAVLEPLLHDKEKFAIAHTLLGIKMRVLAADTESSTYLGLRIVTDSREPLGKPDPDGFDDVQQWWKARREAEPMAFEKLEEASKEVLAKWAALREERPNLLAP